MGIADRMIRLSTRGTSIPCAEMTLLAGDHEPPVVVGEGEITVLGSTSFSYVLRGVPADVGHALKALRRIDRDPYDCHLQEKLEVVTADGQHLSGGWTIPKTHVPADNGPWIFTGEVESLAFHENGEFEAGTEVAYLLPRQHRARTVLRRFMDEVGGGPKREKLLSVNGAELSFTLDEDADLLIARTPAGGVLPGLFAENWIGEPLRVLFGQLIYPRFVLRQSDTWSMGVVRPSPAWSRDTDACALWLGNDESIDGARFWESYRRLLSYIAARRDEAGHPDYEANRLTEFYEEVIQAAHGSRWVWSLTFASAVEGLIDLLGLEGMPRIDLEDAKRAGLEKAIDEFKRYVDLYPGDAAPVEPAKNAADRMLRTTAAIGLRHLHSEGWITREQLKAWEKLRNKVMHGNVVSRYSSEIDDNLLLNLAGLLHALTMRLLHDVDPDAHPDAADASAA
jgi:hypothetical protein